MVNKVLIVGGLAIIVTASAITGVYYLNKNKEEVKQQAIVTNIKQKEDEIRKKEQEEVKKKLEDEAKKKEQEEAKKKVEEEAKKKADEETKKKVQEEASKQAETTNTNATTSTKTSKSTSTQTSSKSGTSSQTTTNSTIPTPQPKPTYEAGINQSLTDIVNSRSSFNNLGMTQYNSMFNDLVRGVATGELSSSSAESQVRALQPWEDNCKRVPSTRALYTIQGCNIRVFTTNSQDGIAIVQEQISRQCKAVGDYGYNIVYTNSDGTNRVVSIGVGCSISPR